jgi:hypothetical protein
MLVCVAIKLPGDSPSLHPAHPPAIVSGFGLVTATLACVSQELVELREHIRPPHRVDGACFVHPTDSSRRVDILVDIERDFISISVKVENAASPEHSTDVACADAGALICAVI